jgi:3'-5' exoribonuclease
MFMMLLDINFGGVRVKKGQFVQDLGPKDAVSGLFLVKYIAVMESKDGKSYLNLVLADSTGEIESRKWHGAQSVANEVSRGDYVFVEGKVNLFQGRLQLIVNEIKKQDSDSINQADFVTKSEFDSSEMFDRLVARVESLNDVYIKELLLAVLFDGEIKRRLLTWQAGKSIHHAYESGLLEHILSCTDLAVSLSAHYKANVNYVVAGCVLHDLCKVYELTSGPIVDYTDEGKLVGHLVKGVELVDRFAHQLGFFPNDLKMHLKHVLLSHHGEYEYGSPKIPQTSEAYLVHLIDYMDSKMNSFAAVKKSDTNPGNWSNFIKHLDRIIYKEELPFYPNKIDQKTYTEEKQKPQQKEQSANNSNSAMAKLLKDIKIED